MNLRHVLLLVVCSLSLVAGGCDKPEEPKRDAASAAKAPEAKGSASSAPAAVVDSASDAKVAPSASAEAPMVDGAAAEAEEDAEADKDDDTSAAGLERRINRLAKNLIRANKRLAKINQTFVNPPDPSKPPIRTALGETKTKAQAIILKADELLAKLGANPQDPIAQITDQDPDSDSDTSPKGVVRRINRVTALLTRTDARFDKIVRTFVNPPDPSKPPIRAALANVKVKAQEVITQADELLKKVDAPQSPN
jgi:hypothetical protein